MSHDPQPFLDELARFRGRRQYGGQNTVWFVELTGGNIVEPTAFEPDPRTHRSEYYYNSKINTLFKRVWVPRQDGVKVAYWKRVSD